MTTFGRRAPRAAARFLLGLALAVGAPAAVMTGCGGGTKLQKINAPAAGVTLAYDFTPGNQFTGHVQRSEIVTYTLGAKITRAIGFDVSLVVQGKDPEKGGNLLVARLSQVDISWGNSEVQDFVKNNLESAEISFNVADNGKIIHMPKLPADLPPQLRGAIQAALDALTSSFSEVPGAPIQIGESWSEEKKRGRKGKLGRHIEGNVTTTVEGLYTTAEGGTEVAKLVTKESEIETTTAKSGSHEVKREASGKALFATKDGFLHSRSTEYRTFDPGNATTFTTVRANWNKAGAATVTPPSTQETQAINDPCNPDYVGPAECKPAGAPADPNAETQAISDPCNPDYVGPEECKQEAAPAGDAPAPAPAGAPAGAPAT